MLDIESFFGTVPAPASVSRTSAEEVMSKHLTERMPKGAKTDIEKKRREEMTALVKVYREGGRAAAQKVVRESDVLRPGDLKTVSKKAGLSHLVYGTKILPIEDALDVYEAASEAEREELLPVIIPKMKTMNTKSKAEREAIYQTIERLGLTEKLIPEWLRKRYMKPPP
jgi:hypothetical protein